jgi:hypothetical protein
VKEFEHKRRIAEEKAAKEIKDLQAVKKRSRRCRSRSARARARAESCLARSPGADRRQGRGRGLKIDRRRIDLREPIKEVGEHKVSVKLLRELVASYGRSSSPRVDRPPRRRPPRKRSTIAATAGAAATAMTTKTRTMTSAIARAARILLRASSVLW